MLTDYLKSRLNFRLDNATNILIVINIAIWLLMLLSKLLLLLFNINFHPYFLEVPSDLALFLRTPWSLLTYCFLHVNFGHILFNMLALYWFGHIAEQHYSARQIVTIYLLGGIAGALLFLFAFNTFPYFTTQFHQTFLLGASASVLAITTAAATSEPSYRINLLFIGSISLKWLAILMVFVSFLGVTGSNAGGDIAHLGGALLGVIYALLEKPISRHFARRRNIFTNHRTYRNTSRNTSHTTTSSYHFQRGTRSTSTDGARSVSPQEPDTSTDGARSVSPDSDIDAILDKIKLHGYASLTPDEKQRLFKH